LSMIPKPEHVPAEHYAAFILLCCWQLWNRRNGVIFRNEVSTLRQTLQACREEARLWGCRLPRSAVTVCDSWCTIFFSAM
ncbi:hypothetical protein BAE44_0023823, partial [Dichanthelium oligosanthes]